MKIIAASFFILGLVSSCSINYSLSDEPQNTADKTQNETVAEEVLTPEQKAMMAKERQEMQKIQKIKCQDAKLDLVEAEATKDIGLINQVTKRIQKHCQPN
ncbi:hypothetical protein L0668_09755 [Paraglaciecola aquimarina]|uniref:Lipoprotein n=1 Tax=Paraglaciecola algarum TaxID=3050085 RepID=A0ABS9D652_9ALTE|nr:hypothetical protein [Paraglaciecola sp. G1-23]MCF2948391.1 hypothetical protein [Paraglaciecola sp. G1-23]